MSIRYSVEIEPYAARHYIKRFEKKYGRAWDITMETLIRELQSLDVLLAKSIAEMIANSPAIKVCKVEFKVAGTDQSRHGSGNRCIIAVHREINAVNVLLVYHKNDLGHGHETAQWQRIIKDNYDKYRHLF